MRDERGGKAAKAGDEAEEEGGEFEMEGVAGDSIAEPFLVPTVWSFASGPWTLVLKKDKKEGNPSEEVGGRSVVEDGGGCGDAAGGKAV